MATLLGRVPHGREREFWDLGEKRLTNKRKQLGKIGIPTIIVQKPGLIGTLWYNWASLVIGPAMHLAWYDLARPDRFCANSMTRPIFKSHIGFLREKKVTKLSKPCRFVKT